MKNLSLLFLTIWMLLCGIEANSQSLKQTIRGSIIDNVTEAPLVGATVQLLGVQPIIAVTADVNGKFEIKDVPVGRQSIEVRFMGYNNLALQNVLLEMGKETNITIRLIEKAFEMEAVVVTADKKKAATQNEMVMVSGRTFSKEETERFAGSLGDPARMVANYAGVVAGGDARNDIVIRGNSPTGLLWRVEGIEVPNPNHFGSLGSTGGPISMLNSNLLANSDFLTGAFPAEYGNTISGAFDINLRSGNDQKYEYLGQIGWNGFEAGAEGPLFKTKSGQNASFLINGRYSTMDVAHKLGVNFGTGAAIPEYKDLTILIDIPGTKFGRFKVFSLMGNSFIELGKTFEEDENSYSSRGVYIKNGANLMVTGVTHNIMVSPKSRLESTISYQTTGSEAYLDSLVYTNQTFQPWVRSYQQEQKVSFSTQWKTKVDSRNTFSVGTVADMIYTSYVDSIKLVNYDYFVTADDVQGKLFFIRGYGEWQHVFSEKSTGYVGISSQYLQYNGEAVVEPRLGFNYKVTPKQTFSIGAGLHSQIHPRVIYYYQEYDSVSHQYQGQTNKDLKMSRSAHLVLGYNYNLTQDFRIKAETYYQYLYKIPVKETFEEFSLVNYGDDYSLPRQDSLLNQGTGTNYGVEFTVEKFLSRGYYALLTTSLYNSTYKGYDGIERNTTFNGNYVVNLLAGYEYKLSDRYTLTFDGKMVSAGGRRMVPYNLDESYATGEVTYDWSKAYEDSYPAYFRLDMRAGLKMNGKKLTHEWAVDIQNVTNRQNVYRDGLDMAKQEVYTVYQIGFFPMFLYRIRF